jgi:hypothetical protein
MPTPPTLPTAESTWCVCRYVLHALQRMRTAVVYVAEGERECMHTTTYSLCNDVHDVVLLRAITGNSYHEDGDMDTYQQQRWRERARGGVHAHSLSLLCTTACVPPRGVCACACVCMYVVLLAPTTPVAAAAGTWDVESYQLSRGIIGISCHGYHHQRQRARGRMRTPSLSPLRPAYATRWRCALVCM